jgi:DTW domain-containing protein YfiP
MATTVNADYCDSCGQVEWLCICEPIEEAGE